MERIYCMNCLRQTPAYPCPLCGYDPGAAPAVGQALEQSILHGRYLTGRALEKNAIEIVYKGLDLEENRPVILREFFPAAQAERLADGRLRWRNPPPEDREALLAQTQRLPREAISDSFSENGTVYTVCLPRQSMPQPETPPERKTENEWIPFLLALLLFTLATLTGIALTQLLGRSII